MTGLGPGPAPPGSPRRPRRADARRNYELLLAAAREVFDQQGVGAPLDEIARRAGVGNATMYRHFPTRQELIVAVYADEVAALCAQGESLLENAAPGEALFTWLEAFTAHVVAKRALPLALVDDRDAQRSGLVDQRSGLVDEWHAAMRSTAEALLIRAQRSGAVHAGLTASDLTTLAHGIALAATDPDQRGRLLQLIRCGTDIAPTDQPR